MKHDSLIFDLDGTLWNASSTTAEGWTQGLKNLGIDRIITPKEIEKVAGKQYLECVNELIPNPIVPVELIIQEFDLQEKIALEKGGDFLYDQVLPIISLLSQKRKIFMVSNCQEWYLELFLKSYNLEKTFVETTCHGMTGLLKSRMILDLIEKHKLISPVYVGDTAGDHRATQEAGVPFAFAQYGFGLVDGYDYLLLKFKDVLSLI